MLSILGNWRYTNEQNEPSSCSHGMSVLVMEIKIHKVPWRKKNKGKQIKMKRTGVFQLGWSDVRKGHFCWELNKGRQKAVSLYWRRAFEKCKGPEATACWFCLRKNKETRWAHVVGRKIKKRSWGWSGNEGWGLESMSYVRQLRRVWFYFE